MKLREIAKLGKDSLIYGLGSVVTRAVGFLLIPVYTAYLSPEDYGVLALITMYGSMVGIVLAMGQHNASFRYYFKAQDEQTRRRVIESLLIILALSGLLALMLLAAARPVARWLVGSEEAATFVRLIVGVVYLDVVAKVPLVLIRARRWALRYVAFTVASTLLTVGCILTFVVGLEQGVLGVLLGQFISTAVATAVLYLWVMRGYLPRWTGAVGKDLLRFGLPLVPSAFLYFAMQYANRYLLSVLASLQAVGLYALAARFGDVMVIANTALRTAWPVFLYGVERDEQAPALYARALTYYVVLCSGVGAVLITFLPEIYGWMVNPRFHASMAVVPLTLAAAAFNGLYEFGGIGMKLRERTEYYVVISAVAAVLAVGLNVLLIPRWGLLGAAAATAAAYAGQALVALSISNRLYAVPYEYRRIVLVLGATAAAVILARTVEWPGLAAALAGKAVCLLLAPALLGVLGFFEADEWLRIRRLLGRASRA